MKKALAVCLSLAICLSITSYGWRSAVLGERKDSYGILDDAVKPFLVARMYHTGAGVNEWVPRIDPTYLKYGQKPRRRKSRQRLPPTWLQTMFLRILLTAQRIKLHLNILLFRIRLIVLLVRVHLTALCIMSLLAVWCIMMFLTVLCAQAYRQATRVYRVLHQCLQSVMQSPLVLVLRLAGYAVLVIEMLLMRSGDIERNPGPVGQLELKDLVTVLTELHEACSDWENIGLALNVLPGVLDNMKGPYKAPKDCLRDAVKKWLHTSSDPSWEAIVQALRSPIVGRESSARRLEQKYCAQERSEPPSALAPSTPSPEPPAVPEVKGEIDDLERGNGTALPTPLSCPEPPALPKVKGQIADLQRRYRFLAHQCFGSLLQQNVDAVDLSSCLMSLNIHLKEVHQKLFDKDLKQVRAITPLPSIWRKVSKYGDFLNYELLEHVVYTYGPDSLKDDMETYVTDLRTFQKETLLCELVEHWPRLTPPPKEAFRELVVKMNKEWNTCILEDIELFRQGLTQTFFSTAPIFLLGEIGSGSVLITWYIPVDVAMTLKIVLQNTRVTELFTEHGVEWLTVDGEECYNSPLRKYASFLKDTYTSKNPPTALTSEVSSDTPLHFSLAEIEREKVSEKVADPFTQSTLRGDGDDIHRKKTPISFTEVGRLAEDPSSRLVLIEGAPGVGKTTFSWEYCKWWARGELLQTMSLVLLLPLRDNRIREAITLGDLFYHSDPELCRHVTQEVVESHGEGVVMWLEGLDEFGQEIEHSVFMDLILGKVLPRATIYITSRPNGSWFLLERHEHHIAQHVEIVGSAKEQIEVVTKFGTPTSIGERFIVKYISNNPIIKAVMFTPVTRMMVLEVFKYNLARNTNLPATMTELYTAFTCKRLSDYLFHHPEYGTQKWTVLKFSDLPPKVHVQFRELCALAYRGIEKNRQIVFTDLPSGCDTLGLMQEVHQLYVKETAPPSYNFIHLTVQEYLAAVHLSELPPDTQTGLIQRTMQYTVSLFGKTEFLNHGHYTVVFQFLSGLTKMVHIPPLITDQMLKSKNKSSLFHWLYEVQDSERTARTLGQEEMEVRPHYSWIPLDCYVTGYCISHSNCPWKLDFQQSVDDKKMEMLSRGCSTTPDHTYTGCISCADISYGGLTSEGIEHFAQLPQRILQCMRKLRLSDNELDKSARSLLATIIPTMNSLEILDLSRNPVSSGGAVELIKALWGHTRLKVLYMERTNIGEEDCECLSELLASSQSLTYLNVHYNNLSPASVDHIISGLCHNSSLTYLYMSGSEFSEDNAVHLSTVLRGMQRCKLGGLELEHSNITASGAHRLAESLCTNSTLKILSLNDDPIGVDGATAFAAMLPVNTSLEKLYLRDDSIGEEGAKQLIRSLDFNKTLKRLWLPEKYRQPSTQEGRIEWW